MEIFSELSWEEEDLSEFKEEQSWAMQSMLFMGVSPVCVL